MENSAFRYSLLQELLSKIVLLVKMEAVEICALTNLDMLRLLGTSQQDCVRAEEILTSTNVDGSGLCEAHYHTLPIRFIRSPMMLYQGISIRDVSRIYPVAVCCL